jgi:tetratricopeptide (TPR) repeat protein
MTMATDDIKKRLQKILGYLAVDSENKALLAEAADLSLLSGDWAGAKALVQRTLALQPDDPVARYRLAVILLQERNVEESVAITQALIDAGENHPAVQYEHARGLAMSARFDEAEPYLAALLPHAASFAELPYLYIRTLHYLGKVTEAIAFADGYAKEHPNDAVAAGMLSLLYLDGEDLVQAAALSAKALEGAPNNLDALVTAGSVALAYEDAEQAKVHFDKAISLSANNGRAWVGSGLVNMLNVDLPAARNDFEKAVESMPGHLGSYNALAWIQILQKDHTAAQKTLEASLEVDRNFGETYGGLAVLAATRGDWDEAKTLAEKAVRLQPASFAGQFARSLVMTHAGHPQRAQALLESVLNNFQVPGGGNLVDAIRRFSVKQQQKKPPAKPL